MGCVPPIPGFLEGLAEDYRTVRRIVDFRRGDDRIPPQLMVERKNSINIEPDLTTLGKIIGGGLPIAAYGGRAEIMKKVAPVGPIYQAGTLSGNPVAVTAGIAMLQYLEAHPEVYVTMERLTAQLTADLPCKVRAGRVGSMYTLFFQSGPVKNYEEAKHSDTERFSKFFHHLLERGVYFPPSQFESGFVSAVHTPDDITYTKKIVAEFLPEVTKDAGAVTAPPRRVLVTGSAKRIGRGIAIELSRRGFSVAIHYNTSRTEAEEVSRECNDAPVFQADLARVKEIRRLFSEIRERFGPLDCLVNNAARFTRFDPLAITEQDWDLIHDVNLKATFFCCQEGAKQMEEAGAGRIVNISSLGGIRPWADHVHYCASKAGVIMLTKALAKAFAPAITVNSVAPGVIAFDDIDEQTQQMIAATPMRRAGKRKKLRRLCTSF